LVITLPESAMLKRFIAAGACLWLIFSTAEQAFPQSPLQTDAWLEDFVQLKREMAAHYANLDWAVAERHIDLEELSELTESRLRESHSEAEARRVIELFLQAFGDGHLSVRWPSTERPLANVKNTKPSADSSLCARLGFHEQKTAPGIAFARLQGFEQHTTPDSKYFPIGVLVLAEGKRIGLVRIALFSEHCFPDLCEAAASQFGLHKDSACDEACGKRVELRAADLLTAALERQLGVLKACSIDALLVDITGNGGGSDWVEPAARTLTSKRLRSPRIGFIKHEHWVKTFNMHLQDVERDAAVHPQSLIAQAAETYRRALSEAKQPVARDAIWRNKPVPSLVAKDPELFASGALPYFKPGELPENPSSACLFYPSRYRYHEGGYSGPLLVLMDENTASAAECFAAMLADNGAAVLLGSRTRGAGFGYTSGGIRTVLKNSGAEVKMPDGVRFRADGANEMAGITPSVLVAWHTNDAASQRAARVLAILPDAIIAHWSHR
jgi:Peptidase family S41